MATADLLIADHSAQGVRIGITYDTGTLQLTAAWADNANSQPVRVLFAVGVHSATVSLPSGRTVVALPAGIALVQKTPLNAPSTLELPVNLTTVVPA